MTGVLLLCAGGCGSDAAAPAARVEPVLQYVVVEADDGVDGRTTVGWSHPGGLASLNGRPYGTEIISPDTTQGGTTSVRRTRITGVVEYEYPYGRGATQVVAWHEDAAGRTATYDCYAPAWNCSRRQ